MTGTAAPLFDLAALSFRALGGLCEGRAAAVQPELQLLQQLFAQRATGRLVAALTRNPRSLVRHGGLFFIGLSEDDQALVALTERARAQVHALLGLRSPTLVIFLRGEAFTQPVARCDAPGFVIIELPRQTSELEFMRVLRHELGHAHLMTGSAFFNEGIATCCEWESLDAASLPALAAESEAERPILRALMLLDGARDLAFSELQPTQPGWVHALAARFFAECHGRLPRPDWTDGLAGIDAEELVHRLETALGESIESVDARLRPPSAVYAEQRVDPEALLASASAKLFDLDADASQVPSASPRAASPLAGSTEVYADGLQYAARLICRARASLRPKLVEIAHLRAAAMRQDTDGVTFHVLSALAELAEGYRLMLDGSDWHRAAPAFDRAGAGLRRAQHKAPGDAIALGLLSLYLWNTALRGQGEPGAALDLLRQACAAPRHGALLRPLLSAFERKLGAARSA